MTLTIARSGGVLLFPVENLDHHLSQLPLVKLQGRKYRPKEVSEDYIRRRRKEGVPDPIIAVEIATTNSSATC